MASDTFLALLIQLLHALWTFIIQLTRFNLRPNISRHNFSELPIVAPPPSPADTESDSTTKRPAPQGKISLPQHSVDRKGKAKARDAARTRNASRKSLLRFSSKGSLNSVPESDDESDVEIGRSGKIPEFDPPEHFAVALDFITSTPRVKPFVRPVSATTLSSESCYSLASAASLSPMITSDIFITTVAAPSTNTSAACPTVDIENGQDVKTDVGNNGLAKRRGFKGAPLFTAKTNKKGSFPSFPAILSPRIPISPPNSGFVTTLSNFWASSPKGSVSAEAFIFPQHIQDDYNQTNPFDTTAESYFAPHLEDSSSTWSDVQEDLYDFSVYYAITEHKPDFFKTSSLRKGQTDVPSRFSSKSKMHARTNIYDMSIYDVCAQCSAKRKSQSTLASNIADPASKPSPRIPWFPESAFIGSPKIWLTPPSAPSSPKRQAAEDDSPTRRSDAILHGQAPVPQSSSARHQSGSTTSLPDAQKSAVSQNPGLRPLILPLHIAKRNASSSPPVWSSKSVPDTEFAYLAATSTPLSSQENIELPIIERPSFMNSPATTEIPKPILVQCVSTPPSPSRSASSSLEKRRSTAMVDILLLLDAAALGAAEVLEAINCEDDSVDVGEVSLVEFVGTVAHAV